PHGDGKVVGAREDERRGDVVGACDADDGGGGAVDHPVPHPTGVGEDGVLRCDDRATDGGAEGVGDAHGRPLEGWPDVIRPPGQVSGSGVTAVKVQGSRTLSRPRTSVVSAPRATTTTATPRAVRALTRRATHPPTTTPSGTPATAARTSGQ